MDELQILIDSFHLGQQRAVQELTPCLRPIDWGKPCGRVSACDTPGCPLREESEH